MRTQVCGHGLRIPMHDPVSAAEMSGVRQLAHPSCLVVVAEMGVQGDLEDPG